MCTLAQKDNGRDERKELSRCRESRLSRSIDGRGNCRRLTNAADTGGKREYRVIFVFSQPIGLQTRVLTVPQFEAHCVITKRSCITDAGKLCESPGSGSNKFMKTARYVAYGHRATDLARKILRRNIVAVVVHNSGGIV